MIAYIDAQLQAVGSSCGCGGREGEERGVQGERVIQKVLHRELILAICLVATSSGMGKTQ